MDETGAVRYQIRGHSYFSCYCCEDIPFDILAADGVTPSGGNITKKWKGCGSEVLEMDNFILTFPDGVDVKQKALLIGALFAVDFLYFEREK